MPFDKSLLPLVYLHSAGCSHADFKKIFLGENPPSYSDVWKLLQEGNLNLDTKDERNTRILNSAKKVDEIQIAKLIEEKGIEIITWDNPKYPGELKNIGHAPYFLYVRGNLRENLPKLIAVVGSRKHTQYAEKVLEKILPDIIHAGIGIVSGGATGVDTIGHTITLINNGYSIAIFGTGIDRCYPAGNKKLFENILEKGGALISHFPLGTGPETYNFPIRNEIVAGISSGVLIPEAGLGSGTLITAQLALEHGRDVFSIPGDIDRKTSEGTNMLISSGQAKCVRCSGDILEEYFDLTSLSKGMTPEVRISPSFSNENERLVYASIERGIDRVDNIARETGIDMSELLITLSMLEILGYIRIDQMGRYMLK